MTWNLFSLLSIGVQGCFFLVLPFLLCSYAGLALAERSFRRWLIQTFQEAPLLHPLNIHELRILSWTENGVQCAIVGKVPHSRLPYPHPWLHVQADITSAISISDNRDNALVAEITLSQPIELTGQDDMTLNQPFLDINIVHLARIREHVRRVAIGGSSELDSLGVRVNFTVDLTLCRWLTIREIPLVKVIRVGDVKAHWKAEMKKRSLIKERSAIETDSSEWGETSDLLTPPDMIQMLLPGMNVEPGQTWKGVRNIRGSLFLTFTAAPVLNITLSKVTCSVLLNKGTVAKATVMGIDLQSSSVTYTLNLDVQPTAASDRPISGMVTTTKGLLSGVLKGAVNGLLRGNWGEGSSILTIRNITVFDEKGDPIQWLGKILEVMELEKDLEAARRVKNKLKEVRAGDVKDAVFDIAGSILKSAGESGHKCTIM